MDVDQTWSVKLAFVMSCNAVQSLSESTHTMNNAPKFLAYQLPYC